VLRRLFDEHALVELARGDAEVAWRLAITARAQRGGSLGDEGDTGGPDVTCARILLDLGQADEAAGYAQAALASPVHLASPYARARALWIAGVCELRRGHAGGTALLDEAEALATAQGAEPLRVDVLLARLEEGGEPSVAIADAAVELALATGLPDRAARACAGRALARARAGDATGADADLRAALDAFDRWHLVDLRAPAILLRCAEAAQLLADDALADALRSRARQRIRRILLDLTDPRWRATYKGTV